MHGLRDGPNGQRGFLFADLLSRDLVSDPFNGHSVSKCKNVTVADISVGRSKRIQLNILFVF